MLQLREVSRRYGQTVALVLILDEPFSGLDPIGTDVMSGVLPSARARARP